MNQQQTIAARDFSVEYRAFEALCSMQVDDDNRAYGERICAYLPNIAPQRPVDYIFICMEPSLDRWASDLDTANKEVARGIRNFLPGGAVAILRHTIRTHLLKAGERYYITDISKGAMKVEKANVAREERYDRWYPLLLMEIELVARSGARIFAVGKAVAKYLDRKEFPYAFATIMHYSRVAAPHRARNLAGRESEFENFKHSISLEQVIATARDVLGDAVPAAIRDETLEKLERTQLSESLLQLAFNYKLAFESS